MLGGARAPACHMRAWSNVCFDFLYLIPDADSNMVVGFAAVNTVATISTFRVVEEQVQVNAQHAAF